MSGSNGDDRVMATAHHILRTLSSDNANDMLRILSSFDDRFSRFSFSLPRDGGDGDAATPTTVPDFEIGNAALQSALDTILKWDFGSSESVRQTFIWTDNRDEAGPYLDAIDSIQGLIDNPPSDIDPAVIDHAQNVLQLAMLRLEEEFRNLMEKFGEPTDPDWLLDITYDNGEGEGEKSGLPEHETSFITMTIDLLPPETVSDLCAIATRMVNSGYQTECTQVFVGNRRAILEESLQRLGLERPTFEDVQRMPWELLESEIAKWIRIMKLAIGVLFHSEKQLCESVFNKASTSLSDLSFVDFARAPMTQLLNFGEAIAIGRRAPEKLFKILDMCEAVQDLLPSIETLFVGETCASVRSEASAILTRLADAARGTFAEFENAVQGQTSRNPVAGGAVHPLTRYVMNYVKFFSDYTKTLNQLLRDRKVGQPGNIFNRSQDTDIGPLSTVTLTLMGLLETNLDAKSKLYKDPALATLFLMNNLHYMVQKSKDDEVRKLVGNDWIKQHSGKLYQYHNDFRRTAWTKVVACLKDEGINISGGFASGASRNVLKERFKNFNAAFEENVKTQSGWIVSDSQLCTELQISITGMILPAYRSFLGRYQNYLDVVKHPEKYVKYMPEDVEEHLNELFEGSSGSMNRRKSFSTAGAAL